jgi:2-C-methyl-D-erythritol 4-phosphate cytidylyltransferase
LIANGAAPADWVLVHDAARPCLTAGEVDTLLDAIDDGPDGGLLALPLADTLKREWSTTDGPAAAVPQVGGTEPRTGLWRALTPQAFRLAPLRAALAAASAAGRSPTDESQAMEWAGHRPRLAPGSATNLKVTTSSDLALAQSILATRAAQGCSR